MGGVGFGDAGLDDDFQADFHVAHHLLHHDDILFAGFRPFLCRCCGSFRGGSIHFFLLRHGDGQLAWGVGENDRLGFFRLGHMAAHSAHRRGVLHAIGRGNPELVDIGEVIGGATALVAVLGDGFVFLKRDALAESRGARLGFFL